MGRKKYGQAYRVLQYAKRRARGWYRDPEEPPPEAEWPDVIDPEEPPPEAEWPDVIDPSGYRRYRRRRRSAPLQGDFPSGNPGNVRTSVEDDYSGSLAIRLTAEYAYADYPTLAELANEENLEGLTQVLADFGLDGNHTKRLARSVEAERMNPPPRPEEPVEPEEPQPEPERPRWPNWKEWREWWWKWLKRATVAEKPTAVAQESSADAADEPPQADRAYDLLRYLEREAEGNGMAPLHSLAAYWRGDVAALKRKERRRLLRRLNDLAEVDRAYRQLAASDPGYASDVYLGSQGYLDRAPLGIDARWVEQTVGDPSTIGKGINLIDLEQGWVVDHQDLQAGGMMPLEPGVNRDTEPDDYKGHHGTAVLGTIVAASDGTGVVGIAPGASFGIASHYQADGTGGHVADAIYAAVRPLDGVGPRPLGAGDVLLLEVQRNYLPAEVEDADFDAIRLASGLGVIVVEAAGNGGRNLDAYRSDDGYDYGKKKKKKKRQLGPRIFNRRSGAFRESGAIMVGAALSALPHNRKRASNYGSRVDCYAWGNRVVTCGYGDLGGTVDQDKYTADFTNTSAASPIIAGAALALQGLYKTATTTTSLPDGSRLLPAQMRALLSDPATGTRQGRRVRGHIGVMPNLRAIVQRSLRIVPEVYLRDRVGDTGVVPASRYCACPDVLVKQAKEAKSQEKWGEGSKTENDPTVGYKVEPGQTNFVYVRMRNRGLRCKSDGQSADENEAKVVATAYWSKSATLITPDMWREIGRSPEVTVPQGDTLAVSEAIEWNCIPDPGYYCLMALIEDPEHPTPLPPGLLMAEGARERIKRRTGEKPDRVALEHFDWYAFLAFLRRNNHLAVRNFHVVDDLTDTKPLGFQVTGTPEGDRGRFFDLEILQRLPAGAELKLSVPGTLAPALAVGSPWKSEPAGGNRRSFDLPPLPSLPFSGVPLAAGAAHDCHFTISGSGAVGQGHSIAIRQLFRGQEVGRITWYVKRT